MSGNSRVVSDVKTLPSGSVTIAEERVIQGGRDCVGAAIQHAAQG